MSTTSTSNRLGNKVAKVKEDLQEVGGIVRNAAQEKLGQVDEKAAKYYEQGRDKVHGVACACEQFLHARPVASVLVAAGVGWLLGRFWTRR
jgi:ElaB/YqjD/DUF883 family membrane-anchored ribosome-binding protein